MSTQSPTQFLDLAYPSWGLPATLGRNEAVAYIATELAKEIRRHGSPQDDWLDGMLSALALVLTGDTERTDTARTLVNAVAA